MLFKNNNIFDTSRNFCKNIKQNNAYAKMIEKIWKVDAP